MTHAQGTTLFVSPDGSDDWSGRGREKKAGDGPFATLARARDEIRKLKRDKGLPAGGVAVELAAGAYELAGALELSAEDSGTAEARITYRARPAAEVRLVGGKALTGLRPVSDPAALARLAEGARGNVLQADLRAHGISEFGSPAGGGIELFLQDRPMPVARWPNEGFVKIVDVVGGKPFDVRGTKGDRVGKFVYEGDRPQRWVGESDVWLHGYWFWDWGEQRHKIEAIDTEQRTISLKPPYHNYGYRKGQWYYAFNALAELDRPGEWCVDRNAGVLYFWPPAPIDKGRAVVSDLDTLVTLKDVSYVTLRGFILEAARGTAITIGGGTRNRVEACTVRNVGSWAVRIDGGTKHGVVGCDVYQTGAGGIGLGGGDRKTLTPAGHYAENNHVHHYSRWKRVYQPGITIYGVGNRASHNLIHNAPHMGMGFGGNDHVIEFNEIHSVCYESNDAGAIYTGRDWTQRGTVIRHNYLHDINGFRSRGCVGVYLDDMFSGTEIAGNVFYRVTRAAFIGGGRDNAIENNIFVDCKPSVHVDARAVGWAKAAVAGVMTQRLKAVPYKQSPWKERFPQLLTVLEDEPGLPKGNVVRRNVSYGGKWDGIHAQARELVALEDNLLDVDPHFVDPENLNFQLRKDSPAYKLGFKRIPVEKIGLFEDELRASWPVRHTVREPSGPELTPEASRAQTRPLFKVPRAKAKIAVDGVIRVEEWGAANSATAMVVEQGIKGEKSGPRSLAWVARDDACLYVAFDNAVDPWTRLRTGDKWGRDDAVEIALRNPGAGKKAPIIVLRGYPSGHFESSQEAGAAANVAKRAAAGVEYKAAIVECGQPAGRGLGASRWMAEWRIPFASLGIDPAKHKRIEFNASVRKSAQPLWQMWRSTGGCTWDVRQAGIIELAP